MRLLACWDDLPEVVWVSLDAIVSAHCPAKTDSEPG